MLPRLHAGWLPVSLTILVLLIVATSADPQQVINPTQAVVGERYVGEMIVYTAHQDWMSRIYFLRPDGSVISYFHYDFYLLADLEAVDNQVYIAEAFAPRGLKLDLDADGYVNVTDFTQFAAAYGTSCE